MSAWRTFSDRAHAPAPAAVAVAVADTATDAATATATVTAPVPDAAAAPATVSAPVPDAAAAPATVPAADAVPATDTDTGHRGRPGGSAPPQPPNAQGWERRGEVESAELHRDFSFCPRGGGSPTRPPLRGQKSRRRAPRPRTARLRAQRQANGLARAPLALFYRLPRRARRRVTAIGSMRGTERASQCSVAVSAAAAARQVGAALRPKKVSPRFWSSDDQNPPHILRWRYF
jgi:hypothetical protein